MDEGSSKPKPTFLSRDWLIQRLKRLAVYVALFVVIGVFIYKTLNPSTINHLVLLRYDDQEFAWPLTATLVGDIAWEQSLEIGMRQGDEGALGVANIPRAWGGGRLTITDNQGTEVASVEIEPRGRYCGALVILIDEDGQARAAFNEVPNSEVIP